MKNFLITGFYFNGFHGSMMHICEMAKTLKQNGYSVYISCVELTRQIKKYVEDFSGAKIFFISKTPLDIEYDYVLGYHEPILTYLLSKGLKAKYVGIGSLSNILPIERPGLLYKYNVPIFVHSKMLADYIKTNFNITDENLFILLNSVLPCFKHKTIVNTDTPLNIAVVSNHIPDEIFDAIKILQTKQIHVDIYGINYHYQSITSETLDKYDVVISIGKTVQYALYKGIPVYNYDKFGGCGYITLSNIDKEEHYNFSGRSDFRTVSSQVIANEILSEYKNVVAQMNDIENIAHQRYDWEINIRKLISTLERYEYVKPNTPEWNTYENMCVMFAENIIDKILKIAEMQHFISVTCNIYILLNKITFGLCYKNKAKMALSYQQQAKNDSVLHIYE